MGFVDYRFLSGFFKLMWQFAWFLSKSFQHRCKITKPASDFPQIVSTVIQYNMYNNSKVKNSLTNDGENEYNMHCEDGW